MVTGLFFPSFSIRLLTSLVYYFQRSISRVIGWQALLIEFKHGILPGLVLIRESVYICHEPVVCFFKFCNSKVRLPAYFSLAYGWAKGFMQQSQKDMKKIIFHVLLTLSFGQFLSAQNRVLTSCNSGQYSMVAAWSDKFQGVIFYADNSVTKEIDTLLLAYPGSFDIQCQCNDTSSTFFIDDNSPILEHFTFERGSWNCSIKSITLPPKFPLVGCLIDGKKYESYKYRLDSQDEISAELEIKVANNELGRLITTERYYAKFIIDYDKGVYKMTKQLRE